MSRTLPPPHAAQTAARSRAEPDRRVLPPGPGGGRLPATIAFHRDPLGYLRRAQERFGDIFTVRLLSGPQVVVADPDLWRAVADSDPKASHAGEARRAVVPMASSRSVFGGDGETHRRTRGRVEAPFAEQAVAERAASMAGIAAEHIRRWPLERPFPLLPRMRLIANEIFARLVLGVEQPARAQRLAGSIERMLWTPGNPPLTVPGPRDGLIGRAVHAEWRRRRAPVAGLIAQELADRRAAADPGPGILGLLLKDEPDRRPEELVEELLIVLMAAQEPMASALTWVALSAAGRPGAQERLAEAGTGGHRFAAFAAESLRLHPPALGILRAFQEPSIMGVPAGARVMVPIPLLQRDPRLFAEPERFRPERAPEGDDPWALAPLAFGGGTRACIGRWLAHAELGTVLGELWQRLRLRPVAPAEERMVLRATILVPHRGGLVSAAAVRAR